MARVGVGIRLDTSTTVSVPGQTSESLISTFIIQTPHLKINIAAADSVNAQGIIQHYYPPFSTTFCFVKPTWQPDERRLPRQTQRGPAR